MRHLALLLVAAALAAGAVWWLRSGELEPVPEEARIEALLTAMEASDLTFLRNGSEYTGVEAAAHLRRKRSAAGGRIRTARQFIDHLATRSSLSGKPYEVREADGSMVPLAMWLDERLREMP